MDMKEELVKLDITRAVAHFWRVLLIGTCLLFLMAGCANGLSETAELDDLVLKLETNRSQAHVGEPVQIRYTVTNTGTRTQVVESNDKPAMDIVVKVMGDGNLQVWSVEHPDQVVHRLEWQPGESKTIEWAWTPKPGDIYDGAYHAVGVSGFLNGPRPEIWQAAGVKICASNFCQ